MATSDLALLHQMDDFILDGKHHEATDAYCRLVAARPEDAARITTHVMTTAAPYLHVPAHHKLLPNGEFRNVNYDHTVLGIRAGLRLMPWLSGRERYLTLAQAVYYVPQGLDVWAQLECGFPGHYAREQEKCAEDLLQATKRLHCHFEDQEPLVEGSVDERFQRTLAAIVDGDKVTSYRLFLGLAAQAELRARLRNEILLGGAATGRTSSSSERLARPVAAELHAPADRARYAHARPLNASVDIQNGRQQTHDSCTSRPKSGAAGARLGSPPDSRRTSGAAWSARARTGSARPPGSGRRRRGCRSW